MSDILIGEYKHTFPILIHNISASIVITNFAHEEMFPISHSQDQVKNLSPCPYFSKIFSINKK